KRQVARTPVRQRAPAAEIRPGERPGLGRIAAIERGSEEVINGGADATPVGAAQVRLTGVRQLRRLVRERLALRVAVRAQQDRERSRSRDEHEERKPQKAPPLPR